MSRKALIPIVLLVVVAVAALLAFRLYPRANGKALRLSGNIELTEVNVSFKVAGRLLERAVDEGDAVKRGMTVARLDQQQLLDQRQRAQAALAASESLSSQLITAIELQSETLEGQIQQQQALVRQAEARLAELEAGSRAQEKEQARAAVERAQTEYDRSARDWQRAQTLFKNEDISASDFDQFRTRYQAAEASLKQAKEQLALVLEGPRKENIEQARAQVAQARASLRLAEAQRLELKRKRQEMDSRRADIEQRKADLAILATQLADTVAVAPIDGVVLVKAAEPGEVLAAGATVVSLGDIDHPWLRAYISERDLGRVKLGQKVRVSTDSFPGKVYSGRVSFISAQAEFTPKQIQTPEEREKLVFRIKIEVENPNHELKSNMPADAEIVLE